MGNLHVVGIEPQVQSTIPIRDHPMAIVGLLGHSL